MSRQLGLDALMAQNSMFIKRTVLTLVVAALFIAAAWSVGAIDPDAACTDQADSPRDKLELKSDVVGGQAPDAEEDGSDGSTPEFRSDYDMVDRSRSP